MNSMLKKLLVSAVRKYGEKAYLITADELQNKWDKCTFSGAAVIPSSPSDLRVRAAIMGQGTIFEEDLEKHIYITTINVGKGLAKNEALVVTVRDGADVAIAACAHEGFFSQHLAEKAVHLVEEKIANLPIR